MRLNKDIQQHFSIRKLSVGAASVLIGISFLGYGAQTVHADTTNEKAPQSVIETKVEGSNSPVTKTSDETAVPKASETTPVKPVAKSEANTPKPVASESKASTDSKNAAVDAVQKDVTKKAAAAKETAVPQTGTQQEKKTKASADSEKEQVLDLKGKKAIAAKTLKEQKSEENPAWSLTDWTYTENNNDLTLNKYNGTSTTVYIPTATDVNDKYGKNYNQVHINGDTVRSFKDKATDVIVSHNGDKKVVYDGWDMAGAFANANNLKHLDLANLDVSQVAYMENIFANDKNLESVDVSGWDTSHVAYLYNTFAGDSNLSSIVGLNSWDVANAQIMRGMFSGCSSLTSLDLNWGNKTNKVRDFNSMFSGDSKLTSITGIGDWDVSSAADMGYMFKDCSSLTNLKLNWGDKTRNVTQINSMFNGDSKLTAIDGISAWDLASAVNMGYMFAGDSSLESLDLSNWKLPNAMWMDNMFLGDSSLKSVGDLSGWNIKQAHLMNSMFNGDSSLESVGDLSNWDVGNVTDMSYMFNGCHALTKLDLDWQNKTSNVVKFNNMFANDEKLTSINGIDNWNVASAQDLSYMFDCVLQKPWSSEPGSFVYDVPEGNLRHLNLSTWDTSNVTNMEGLFRGQKELTSIGDFQNWQTGNVQNMRSMFEYCQKLHLSDQALNNMSKWDTSKVTTMREMFEHLESQEKLNCMDHWNTSNVQDMSYMFNGDKNLVDLGDLSGWDTSKVGTLPADEQNYGMSNMFAACEKLPEIKGIGSWNVANVTKMRQMFMNTYSLQKLDLSNWDTQNLKIAGEMFAYSGVQDLDLSGFNLTNLAHFSGSGMLNEADQSHRGSEDMFAYLRRPAVITLNNITLPADVSLKLLVDDFKGEQPIVVFSNNSAVNNLNKAHWTDSNNQAVTGRQNSDYLTIYQGTTTTKVPMNFVYKDQAALDNYLAEKLAPFGNIPRTGSRVGANAAAALQDVTGIYGTPSNPDIPDPGDDNHHEQPGDDDKPEKPNIDDDQPTQPNINEDKPERPNIDDETPQIPHLAGDQVRQYGQQVAHKTAQAAVTKQTANKLPQTGDKKASLAWLGLGLASLAALLGLAGDRKRR